MGYTLLEEPKIIDYLMYYCRQNNNDEIILRLKNLIKNGLDINGWIDVLCGHLLLTLTVMVLYNYSLDDTEQKQKIELYDRFIDELGADCLATDEYGHRPSYYVSRERCETRETNYHEQMYAHVFGREQREMENRMAFKRAHPEPDDEEDEDDEEQT